MMMHGADAQRVGLERQQDTKIQTRPNDPTSTTAQICRAIWGNPAGVREVQIDRIGSEGEESGGVKLHQLTGPPLYPRLLLDPIRVSFVG